MRRRPAGSCATACLRANRYRYSYGRQANRTLRDIGLPDPSRLPEWVRDADPGTEVLADGFSCRTQLDGLATRSGRHLAQLLADRLQTRRRPG